MSSPTGGTDSAQAAGGDGFTFCIQPNSNTAIGDTGEGLGYGGIGNSIAVEFDTFQNGFDPNDNHIAVDLDGDVDHGDPINSPEFNGANIQTDLIGLGFDLKDGNPHYAWIDYDGTNLTVRLGNTNSRADSTLILSDPVNLSNIINTSSVYVGFTASAGAAYEEHDILQWDYASE